MNLDIIGSGETAIDIANILCGGTITVTPEGELIQDGEVMDMFFRIDEDELYDYDAYIKVVFDDDDSEIYFALDSDYLDD